MNKTTKQMINEVLGVRQSAIFWPKLTVMLRTVSTPLPAFLKDTGTSWDDTVAALERWYDELPDLEGLTVTDVPQPVVVVKKCREVSAMWHAGDNHVDFDQSIVPAHIPVPVPLILAMADAIRKTT